MLWKVLNWEVSDTVAGKQRGILQGNTYESRSVRKPKGRWIEALFRGARRLDKHWNGISGEIICGRLGPEIWFLYRRKLVIVVVEVVVVVVVAAVVMVLVVVVVLVMMVVAVVMWWW